MYEIDTFNRLPKAWQYQYCIQWKYVPKELLDRLHTVFLDFDKKFTYSFCNDPVTLDFYYQIVHFGHNSALNAEIVITEWCAEAQIVDLYYYTSFYHRHLEVKFITCNGSFHVYLLQVQGYDINEQDIVETANFISHILDEGGYVNTRKRKLILDSLNSIGFAGTLPSTLDRQSLKQIKSNHDQYAITVKLDGRRFLLYKCPYDADLYSLCRNGDIRLITNINSKILPLGWLADTEYIDGVYHIFDIICELGRDYRELQKGLFARLRYTSQLLLPMELTMKPHFLLHNDSEQALHAYKKQHDNHTDGYVISRLDLPYYKERRDPFMMKWKSTQNQTIDFEVKSSMCLQVVNRKGDLIPFLHYQQKPVLPFNCSTIAEFSWDNHNQSFKYIRNRLDKSLPNYLHTALDVWKAIQEDIQEREILQFLL